MSVFESRRRGLTAPFRGRARVSLGFVVVTIISSLVHARFADAPSTSPRSRRADASRSLARAAPHTTTPVPDMRDETKCVPGRKSRVEARFSIARASSRARDAVSVPR